MKEGRERSFAFTAQWKVNVGIRPVAELFSPFDSQSLCIVPFNVREDFPKTFRSNVDISDKNKRSSYLLFLTVKG